MVNYLYDLDDIEKNHEAYAQQRIVVASSAVTKLVRVRRLRSDIVCRLRIAFTIFRTPARSRRA